MEKSPRRSPICPHGRFEVRSLDPISPEKVVSRHANEPIWVKFVTCDFFHPGLIMVSKCQRSSTLVADLRRWNGTC